MNRDELKQAIPQTDFMMTQTTINAIMALVDEYSVGIRRTQVYDWEHKSRTSWMAITDFLIKQVGADIQQLTAETTARLVVLRERRRMLRQQLRDGQEGGREVTP